MQKGTAFTEFKTPLHRMDVLIEEIKGGVTSPFASYPCQRQAKAGLRGIFIVRACLPRPRSGPGPVGRGDEPVMKDCLRLDLNRFFQITRFGLLGLSPLR